MRTRFSPALAGGILTIALASGGIGYAAGKVTSAQIKDGTIQGRDIRNGTITGTDVMDRSLPRTKVKRACAAGELPVFGGCVRLQASGPTSYQAAIDDCNRRNGRLPTTAEIKWIAAHDEYGWADGNLSNYEFTGDYTATSPFTPIAFDRAGNSFNNASAHLFWHHCVTY
ncbi:hypothetical protein ACFQ0K_18285 [Nocardioides caeni]|uniref:Uncharacterized protein n=1 Tax=Nocardioides caeni TaxID=574700 RepID=A0A4S8NBS2_9ACTN|nr:hypothetical protein [Nocardioides caeni]THV13292.1 hypothetical protein E9934_10000 [Nocardioides caeni]